MGGIEWEEGEERMGGRRGENGRKDRREWEEGEERMGGRRGENGRKEKREWEEGGERVEEKGVKEWGGGKKGEVRGEMLKAYLLDYTSTIVVTAISTLRQLNYSYPVTYIRGRRGRSLLEDHTQDGKQEGSSLARAGLGTSHEVTIPHDDRESILLHWGRLGVFCQLHVRRWREGGGRGGGGGGGGERREEERR